MKKTYIKPQATVVAIEDKSHMLCSSPATYGTKGSTILEDAFSSEEVSGVQGLSKRNGGGLWDDDEE